MDGQDQHERTQRRNEAFDGCMDGAVDAYLAYSYHSSEGRGTANYESLEVDGSLRVRIIDFDSGSLLCLLLIEC